MSVSTDYLRAAFAGDLTALTGVQLLAGLSNEEAAAVCFVSRETFRRWHGDRPANRTALRLLAIFAGYVPWPGWRDWEVHDGLLFPPGYSRHGISPGDIITLPYLRAAVRIYRNENMALRRLVGRKRLAAVRPAVESRARTPHI